MNRILITGGLGYIGGRLALALRWALPQAEVSLGIRPGRIRPAWAADFPIREMDLNGQAMPGALPQGLDLLIHLAALNERQCLQNPGAAMLVNALGTYRLLEEALRAGVKRVIYFSTFHVYGPQAGQRITETSPTRSSHPYASSHRAAEDIVDYFRQYHDLPGLIFRLSNAFGPPADPGVNRWSLVFNDLCRQAVTTSQLALNSSGLQHRDFIPLRDVASAVLHFATRPESWGDGLFNLGSGKSLSILEAASHVARVYAETFNRPRPPITAPQARPGEISRPIVFAVDKLLGAGFTPAGDMDEEIRGCLNFCAGQFQAGPDLNNGGQRS